MKRYQIVFDGSCDPSLPLEEVKRRLSERTKASPQIMARLFSGRPIVIKKGLAHSDALAYQAAFEKTGAHCEVVAVPEGDGTEAPAGQPPQSPAKVLASRNGCRQAVRAEPVAFQCLVEFSPITLAERRFHTVGRWAALGLSNPTWRPCIATVAGEELHVTARDRYANQPSASLDIRRFEIARARTLAMMRFPVGKQIAKLALRTLLIALAMALALMGVLAGGQGASSLSALVVVSLLGGTFLGVGFGFLPGLFRLKIGKTRLLLTAEDRTVLLDCLVEPEGIDTAGRVFAGAQQAIATPKAREAPIAVDGTGARLPALLFSTAVVAVVVGVAAWILFDNRHRAAPEDPGTLAFSVERPASEGMAVGKPLQSGAWEGETRSDDMWIKIGFEVAKNGAVLRKLMIRGGWIGSESFVWTADAMEPAVEADGGFIYTDRYGKQIEGTFFTPTYASGHIPEWDVVFQRADGRSASPPTLWRAAPIARAAGADHQPLELRPYRLTEAERRTWRQAHGDHLALMNPYEILSGNLMGLSDDVIMRGNAFVNDLNLRSTQRSEQEISELIKRFISAVGRDAAEQYGLVFCGSDKIAEYSWPEAAFQ